MDAKEFLKREYDLEEVTERGEDEEGQYFDGIRGKESVALYVQDDDVYEKPPGSDSYDSPFLPHWIDYTKKGR